MAKDEELKELKKKELENEKNKNKNNNQNNIQKEKIINENDIATVYQINRRFKKYFFKCNEYICFRHKEKFCFYNNKL